MSLQDIFSWIWNGIGNFFNTIWTGDIFSLLWVVFGIVLVLVILVGSFVIWGFYQDLSEAKSRSVFFLDFQEQATSNKASKVDERMPQFLANSGCLAPLIYLVYFCLSLFIVVVIFKAGAYADEFAFMVGGILSPLLFALIIWAIAYGFMDQENRRWRFNQILFWCIFGAIINTFLQLFMYITGSPYSINL